MLRSEKIQQRFAIDEASPEVEMDENKLPIEPTEHNGRFRYDYVIVFPSPETAEGYEQTPESEKKEEQNRDVREDILDRLIKAGLKVELFYSRDKDEIFCKVGATEQRLKMEAERVSYMVQLKDDDRLRGVFTEFHIKDPGKRPIWDLVKYYTMTDCNGEKYPSLFRNKDRFRLINSIFQAPKGFGGAHFNTEELIEQKKIKEGYFLHDMHEQSRLKLNENWANWRRILWYQPVDAVRFYFGEDISLYFAWLGFYVEMLKFPALFGLIVFFIWVPLQDDHETYKIVVTIFSFFMALWASFFLEFWKRRNAIYVVRWGTANFEDMEHNRYQFWGSKRKSPITGQEETYFGLIERLKRLFFSWATIIMFIAVVIISILGIFALRIVLDSEDPPIGWTTGIINGILILIFNQIYARIAVWLNNLENHRTDTTYRDHLIAKTFLFQFINSYNTMFFIAFVKKFEIELFNVKHVCLPKDGENPYTPQPDGTYLEGQGPPNCMGELRIQLAAIFGTALIVNNCMEILKPLLAARWEARQEEKAVKERELEPLDPISTEGQSKMPPYEGVLDDYAELVVQYGYVTLFVAAFPIAPVLAFLNNLAEIRVDATKILKLSQRPFPGQAQDIGTWYYVLEIMSFMAVLTNMGILMFTSDAMDFIYDKSESGKVWTFIISSGIIFLLKVIIDASVPDHPEQADIMLKRQEYIIQKYIFGIEDDDEIGDVVVLDKDVKSILNNIPDEEPTSFELEIGSSKLLAKTPVENDVHEPDVELATA